jgi:hypothetical protein
MLDTLNARRVMPGVMSPLHVEPKKIPAVPQLNAAQVGWIMEWLVECL